MTECKKCLKYKGEHNRRWFQLIEHGVLHLRTTSHPFWQSVCGQVTGVRIYDH